MDSFAAVPAEVLEHIAFFAATDSFLGPPGGVTALLNANRRTYLALSLDSNPHLWARIFSHKFDFAAAERRLGGGTVSAVAIAGEFKRRCEVLKRIRACKDTFAKRGDLTLERAHQKSLNTSLWTVYLMMLENDDRNEKQLRDYAHMDQWLKDFLFHEAGASLMRANVADGHWPPSDERTSLAIWMFWFLLRPDDHVVDDEMFLEATNLLKIVALGAHQYALCRPTWRDFRPPYYLKESTLIEPYSHPLQFEPPSPAAPAILAYLTLINKLSISWDTINYLKPSAPIPPSTVPGIDSSEWDAEWTRGLHLSRIGRPLGVEFSGAFIPGSLEGIWEGLFTYTEFTTYAALLSGAEPSALQQGRVAQHPHYWRIREHHLLSGAGTLPITNGTNRTNGPQTNGAQAQQPDQLPLSPGDPLRAYIPQATEVRECPLGLEIKEPGRKDPVWYYSWGGANGTGRAWDPRRVRDVFITGEGHSAWGQFNLVGRVRPCDGFISLYKEYIDGDRGRWLYRGYLVGNAHGNLSGRWRDTLSPAEVLGYEGCFIMSRRT
ncbi:hypothetical protein OBBRIDRAFT_791118 [Obba rivulosa]|uniref:Uncharacterized protein n=1 Tax=Obba rivulosa TaxID=1052685 RepID=A0A8E2B0K1_9APHY|nr:hypothetical protein OBBRIDRAFT_791118 [Obba rivulosa]